MDKVIYQDNERIIRLISGTLEIESNGKRLPVSPALETLPNPIAPPAKQAIAIRQAGKDPADYDAYLLPFGRDLYLLAPKAATPALLTARNEYRAEMSAIRNDPATVERRRIENLYAQAKQRINYPGEYYLMLADADDALKAWREKYPKAAAKERADNLRAQADKQDSLATGALVYDADGSFSSEEQEHRAAEFRAKAAELRAEAEKIEEAI